MKTQMKFQKIMCLVMLLMGALSAIYCFMYCSGGLANIGLTLSKKDGKPAFREGFEEAQQVYLDAQVFNNVLLILSIVMIVAAVLLYITATNKRRNYYVSNYVATGVVCVVDFFVSIYVLIANSMLLSRFKGILADEALNKMYQTIADKNDTIEYVTSTWNFALGYVVYILVILACAALILNLVWKIKLMKGEKALLSGAPASPLASEVS